MTTVKGAYIDVRSIDLDEAVVAHIVQVVLNKKDLISHKNYSVENWKHVARVLGKMLKCPKTSAILQREMGISPDEINTPYMCWRRYVAEHPDAPSKIGTLVTRPGKKARELGKVEEPDENSTVLNAATGYLTRSCWVRQGTNGVTWFKYRLVVLMSESKVFATPGNENDCHEILDLCGLIPSALQVLNSNLYQEKHPLKIDAACLVGTLVPPPRRTGKDGPPKAILGLGPAWWRTHAGLKIAEVRALKSQITWGAAGSKNLLSAADVAEAVTYGNLFLVAKDAKAVGLELPKKD